MKDGNSEKSEWSYIGELREEGHLGVFRSVHLGKDLEVIPGGRVVGTAVKQAPRKVCSTSTDM